jgi:hypothetical protein
VLGVPEIEMVLFDHEAVTPAGRLSGLPIPVAPDVIKRMDGIGEPKQIVGFMLGAET